MELIIFRKPRALVPARVRAGVHVAKSSGSSLSLGGLSWRDRENGEIAGIMEPSEKLGSYLATSGAIVNERSLKSASALPRAARIWRESLGELTAREGGGDKPNGRRGCISRVNKISCRAVG